MRAVIASSYSSVLSHGYFIGFFTWSQDVGPVSTLLCWQRGVASFGFFQSNFPGLVLDSGRNLNPTAHSWLVHSLLLLLFVLAEALISFCFLSIFPLLKASWMAGAVWHLICWVFLSHKYRNCNIWYSVLHLTLNFRRISEDFPGPTYSHLEVPFLY